MDTENTVYAVYGDIGGARETLPAMQMLVQRGIRVQHFVSGERARAGTEVLGQVGVSYETRGPEKNDAPSLIVVATSATAVEGQIKWTQFGGEHNKPVIWVEDLWGTGSREITQSVSPDVMCVIDDIAAGIAQRVRPDIQVVVVGKPTFGALAEKLKDAEGIRKETRAQLAARLGIKNFAGQIITYCSGGEFPARVYSHIDALRCIRPIIPKGMIFVPRLHPKLPEIDKLNLRLLAQRVGAYVVMAHDLDMDFLTVASDVNLGDWGTTSMYTSVMFGVPAIMCLFPDDKQQRIAAGYPDGVPPLLLAGAGYGPTDIMVFSDLLKQIWADPAEHRKAAWENGAVFRELLKPGAEDRIANVVMRYL